MKLIILITAKMERGLDIAQAWQNAGAPGCTIIPAHGLYSLQQEMGRGSVELPRVMGSMTAAMGYVLENVEKHAEVVLSVVPDDLVERLEAIANDILGDLREPDTGVMFVLALEQTFGVQHHDRHD